MKCQIKQILKYIGNMKLKLLITGAAGFLGGRTAKYFAQDEAYDIVATSRRKDRKIELENAGCHFIAGDLTDETFCATITKNIDVVIHCAALSAPFGLYADFYNSNFIATKHLLDASKRNGVRKFIFISTPSIYFNYSDRFDVKESEPLPKHMVNNYAATKLLAERLVLENNDQHFQTIALRPRAIIGAEDTVIFPRVLEAYQKGKLKIVGNGQNICDLTCVSNVIEAVKCAMYASNNAYGEAYNITDGNAIKFWETVNYALTSLGYEPVKKMVNQKVALFAASIMEGKAKLFRDKKEPTLTRYGIGVLSQHFTLSIEKAKTHLEYEPKMTTLEGVNEYIKWHQSRL